MLYLVIFFVFALISLLLSLKLNILVEYIRNDGDDNLVLSLFTLGGLIKLKYEIPFMDIQQSDMKIKKIKELGKKEKDIKKEKKKLTFNDMINNIRQAKEMYEKNKDLIKNLMRYIEKKLLVKDLRIDITVGTGDACYTGFVGGLLWSVAGILLSLVANNLRTGNKHIDIKPDFAEKKFNVDVYCIFRIRIVHIIVIGIKILSRFFNKKMFYKKAIGGGIVG